MENLVFDTREQYVYFLNGKVNKLDNKKVRWWMYILQKGKKINILEMEPRKYIM